MKFKDISLFFSSKCCINEVDSSGERLEKPSTLVRTIDTAYNFFKHMPPQSLNATTITIGNKYYGKMDYISQYKAMARDIKLHIRRSNCRHYYTFELQNNGQLHAHGLEYNTYQANFIASFSQYGRHNTSNLSFQKVNNLENYWKYINKENLFKPITDITKNDGIEDFEKRSPDAEGKEVLVEQSPPGGAKTSYNREHIARSPEHPNIKYIEIS